MNHEKNPAISLDPRNPHYYLFRGRPTILISSAEHYGAVLNLDFDEKTYLNTLAHDGMNYTRVFTGAYCEDPAAFNIKNNTLAPEPDRFICPWERSQTPGYANGGNRFDLNRWDDAYFQRLKSFCAEAGRHGIVVEVSLFCPFYNDSMWKLSPMNAANNINGVGNCASKEVYTLAHPDLTRAQDSMTRKIVEELRDFDNVVFEICNEPYFGGVTLDWQRHIAATIAAAEAGSGRRHLIAQNIANQSARVENPDPNVSILNFHYASPPTAVAENYGLNRVIGFDETGFRGVHDDPYRTDAWEFILAGGALYNNLDYSFTTDHPDGTAIVTDPTPGGGGPKLRAELKTLKGFIDRLPFDRMRPAADLIRSGAPEYQALAEPGTTYAIYFQRGASSPLVMMNVPAGKYHVEWVNPVSGVTTSDPDVSHAGGDLTLRPPYQGEIALMLTRA